MRASSDYIEQIIDTYLQAAQANERTPARSGNVIELDDDLAQEVLVTADLHGHRRNFHLIKRLADLEHHPLRHLVLQEVCHGGPTETSNGGCLSFEMLEDVARLKVAFPERVHFLLSNHELAELTDYPILKNRKMLNLLFRMGMQSKYGEETDRVREAMREFISSCPLAVRLPGDVWICHSLPEQMKERGFKPEVFRRPWDGVDLTEQGDVFRLVWGRDFSPENARLFAQRIGAKALVHGHEPCPDGFRVPNDLQLILDCSSDKACYALLPTTRPLTHADVVAQVKRLGG